MYINTYIFIHIYIYTYKCLYIYFYILYIYVLCTIHTYVLFHFIHAYKVARKLATYSSPTIIGWKRGDVWSLSKEASE